MWQHLLPPLPFEGRVEEQRVEVGQGCFVGRMVYIDGLQARLDNPEMKMNWKLYNLK